MDRITRKTRPIRKSYFLNGQDKRSHRYSGNAKLDILHKVLGRKKQFFVAFNLILERLDLGSSLGQLNQKQSSREGRKGTGKKNTLIVRREDCSAVHYSNSKIRIRTNANLWKILVHEQQLLDHRALSRTHPGQKLC